MSKINVDTIDKQSGSTVTVGGPGTNIVLGTSGQSVTLGCGATQSGFGRSGSVNWCSTIYTNSPGTVTATSGKGFFLNTTSGAITINLPSSPTVGDIVAIKDYANTFNSNAVTVGRGGSKIGGLCLDATLGTEGESVTLIYADATKGWLNVNTDSTIVGSAHIVATGGTESTSGDYKIHTFTSSGTFQVTAAGTPSGSTKISYMVIAGGGGGARDGAGGAGAGGYREGKCSSDPYTASPLAATPCSALTASLGTFPITVGAGGTVGGVPACTLATQGSSSIFSTITSAGGGRAGMNPAPNTAGGAGGSGGGGRSNVGAAGGAGNTPPVSPPQGNPGGSSSPSSPPYNQWGGGGGGGAGGAGSNYPPGGQGGAGVTSSINATPTVRASGGAGGSNNPAAPAAAATPGGGGAGGSSPGGNGGAGTANTGGGGGSGACAGSPSVGGAGGSGIVIIRYKFQN